MQNPTIAVLHHRILTSEYKSKPNDSVINCALQ